uniref:NADH-ubiquinone oxidoreductase chain 1 n=1 Tax=Ishige okamurae TaxID=233772 RepID=A0A4Y5T7U4_9PHAE|nr:NADH dehydrogenase subunit 1 [Ishige okamurae]QDB64153.1 NADH dehydrogenase subunit 1 [Ishige okamurae]WBP70191.1 NADH dehydrogenase subunit 1 [Ishige okamurae]
MDKILVSVLLNFGLLIIPLLISVAYLTLGERKLMGAIQRREGPNVVGFIGLLQPLSDGLKLFVKETIVPINAENILFIIGPILTFTLSLINWSIIPIGSSVIADIHHGIPFFLAVSSLAVYGVLISGWSSNSKYSFLGGLRSAAQMIAYEVSFGLILISIVLCSGSLCFSEIVEIQKTQYLGLPLFPLTFLFYISSLAETNRHPFDLPEAESEIVSGYNTEYSSMQFALFFLGEYANMISMGALGSVLFTGGSVLGVLSGIFLGLKICLYLSGFIIIRATIPRLRYDQLMRFGWKCLLPISLSFVLFNAGILFGFNILPG